MTNYGYVPPNAGDVNYGVRVALDKSLRALRGAVAVDANAYTDTKFAAVPAARYQVGATTANYSGTPVHGSLMYETSNTRYRHYNGSSWGNMPQYFQPTTTASGNFIGAVVSGNLSYETSNTQLVVYNGSSWVIVPHLARGYMTSASTTADNTSVSSSFASTGLSVTFTPNSTARRVKYTVTYHCYGTAVADSMEMQIDDGAGTLKVGPWRFAAGSELTTWQVATFVGTETSLSGSTTRRVTFRREGGSGTVHFGGNGTIGSTLLVEDIGT